MAISSSAIEKAYVWEENFSGSKTGHMITDGGIFLSKDAIAYSFYAQVEIEINGDRVGKHIVHASKPFDFGQECFIGEKITIAEALRRFSEALLKNPKGYADHQKRGQKRLAQVLSLHAHISFEQNVSHNASHIFACKGYEEAVRYKEEALIVLWRDDLNEVYGGVATLPWMKIIPADAPVVPKGAKIFLPPLAASNPETL